MSRKRRENGAKREEAAPGLTGWRLPEGLSLPPRQSRCRKALLAAALLLQASWMAFLAVLAALAVQGR
jgi:hypothetical protein